MLCPPHPCCCALLRGSEASPRHPLSPPVKGLPSVWKPFLLHSSLPLVRVPYLFFCLCFFFFLLPYQLHGEFLAFWEVWGLLPAFSRCSVGVFPHVDVFLICLWGGRRSLLLTPPSSWRSPCWDFKTALLPFSLFFCLHIIVQLWHPLCSQASPISSPICTYIVSVHFCLFTLSHSNVSSLKSESKESVIFASCVPLSQW